MKKVLIAGLSGFVGTALAKELASQVQLVGTSRSGKLSLPSTANNIEVKKCDLFNYHETQQALKGIDYAVYLVHSMLPKTRLTQASFSDLDFVIADNFARAAKEAGVKQIIYLGGLIPHKYRKTSQHLKSRLEVEQVLSAYGTPLTALRAGMIIGDGGSSFLILKRLVARLPVLICPPWGSIPTQPIALKDVVRSIKEVLGNERHFNHSYDIGAPQPTTYRKLMESTARLMAKVRYIFSFSLITPGLSRLWISLITGAPKNLVAPLVRSLRTPMVVDESRALSIPNYPFQGVEEALTEALAGGGELPHAFKSYQVAASGVRSIQRVDLKYNFDIQTVPDQYFKWLNGIFGFVRVRIDGDNVAIGIKGLAKPLIALQRTLQSPTLATFQVVGGLLTRPHTRGLLEFRKSPLNYELFTDLHDFEPSLPWTLYAYTHAQLHRYVMRRFGNYLRHQKS